MLFQAITAMICAPQRELKEKGFNRVLHRSGTEITPDISTKNTDLNQWMKQTTKFMSYPGDD